MVEIAKNDYYSMSYDKTTNCVYWQMKGFWKDMSVAPSFFTDWDKALGLARPGWKIFSDTSQCKVVPPEVEEAKIQNQKRMIKNGCIKIARIVDSAITKMSLNKEIQQPGMNVIFKEFSSRNADEAKSWLNQ